MNAAFIACMALIFLWLGYRFYGRYLARHVYRTEGEDAAQAATPAHTLRDEQDYVPARKYVLFGHHFASIAGAAPILGPAIAIIWGWVPALLWVVLGTVFMGAVHDFGGLVISVRHKGQSIGSITEQMIGRRSKLLFLTIIFLLIFIVLAVFAYAIAKLFILYPGAVIPVNVQIIIAILIGWWTYRRGGNLLWPSLLALVLLYVAIYVGYHFPVRLPEFLWLGGSETLTWICLLMGYSMIASVLPVWLLLQPRDYINSHMLLAGLAIIYIAIFYARPPMDAPAFDFGDNPMSWFPFLFITIACGAISGFHALVASGTTSKQLQSIGHARLIGYGGMLGEAALAVAATIAVAAGFGSSEAWHHHYSNFDEASGMQGAIAAFVNGTAGFLQELGITQSFTGPGGEPHTLAAVFISVLVVSFAATSLDTATRIQRYIIGELGETFSVPLLRNNIYVQTFLAVLLSFLLVISDGGGQGGLRLWPLFGATNQLVGALALLVLSVWLFRLKSKYWFTLLPMLFITAITLLATVQNTAGYVSGQRWLLVVIGTVIGGCQLWIIGEAVAVFRKLLRER